MSRSGYTDDYGADDQWGLIRWRGAVNSAIKGKRGQAFLRELAAAMDAMPVKELVANEFQAEGQFCTLGVVGAARGVDLSKLDPDDCDVRVDVAKALGIAEAMAAEVMYENDDDYDDWHWIEVEVCGPMQLYERHKRTVRVDVADAAGRRWRRMRAWVEKHIVKEAS